MTNEERDFWKSKKGQPCQVAYDPPYDTAIIVGIRLARSFPCHDAVVVRFPDGSRMSVRPRQVTLFQS